MSTPRKVVGVLGGMGPAATLDFFSRVLALTPATRDADHVRLIIDCNPHVPDRNVAAPDGEPTAGEALAAMARGLAAAGADLLVMPCNAAHANAAAIVAATPLPFIDMVEATADATRAAIGARTAGVLAAGGTLDAGLYQKALSARGLRVLTADEAAQARFMDLLHRIKAGDVGREVRAEMQALADQLIAGGADAIVAGCTEIPLVLDAADLTVPLINCTEMLARATVAAALA